MKLKQIKLIGPFLVVLILFNSCGRFFNICDYFEEYPNEKKKKDIMDILSNGHWYLAEYYIDGTNAIDTVKKYRLGEDLTFGAYTTENLECYDSPGKSQFEINCYECKEIENKIAIGIDTFLTQKPIQNCKAAKGKISFVNDYPILIQLFYGRGFIYKLKDTFQLKNKDYIKFPFGSFSYHDAQKNEKYYEAKYTIEESNNDVFAVRTKFFGVIYLFKFKRKP